MSDNKLVDNLGQAVRAQLVDGSLANLLQDARFFKCVRGRKTSTIAIYKQWTPTFLSAISPIMFHAKTSQTHDISTDSNYGIEYLGLGKVMWYQEKVRRWQEYRVRTWQVREFSVCKYGNFRTVQS